VNSLIDIDPQERIKELNNLLNEEIQIWEELGVEPNNVVIKNEMKTDIWIQTLTKHLAETGIIDENKFMIMFKEKMLQNLKNIRAEIEPKVKAAKMEAMGIHLPNMDIPKGKLRKLN
jgi:hypothetical protein